MWQFVNLQHLADSTLSGTALWVKSNQSPFQGSQDPSLQQADTWLGIDFDEASYCHLQMQSLIPWKQRWQIRVLQCWSPKPFHGKVLAWWVSALGLLRRWRALPFCINCLQSRRPCISWLSIEGKKRFDSFYSGLCPGISLGRKESQRQFKGSTQIKAFWRNTTSGRFPAGGMFNPTDDQYHQLHSEEKSWGKNSWDIWRETIGSDAGSPRLWSLS